MKVLSIKSGCDTIESRIVSDYSNLLPRGLSAIYVAQEISFSDVKYLKAKHCPKRSNVLPLFDYVSLNNKFLEQQLGHRQDF